MDAPASSFTAVPPHSTEAERSVLGAVLQNGGALSAAVESLQAFSSDIQQVCGFHVLSRLFMQKKEPNERGISEFLDQAQCALQGESLLVRKAAMQSVIRFAELGLVYERVARSAMKQIGMDFL